MKKKNNKTKKTQQQLHRYKNMVKYKTEYDDTDNEKMFIKDLQGTNETINENSSFFENKEADVQKPPLSYRTKEFFESHFTELLIAAIIGLAGWSIKLQIGQAIQENKVENVYENIKEIRRMVEDKYIKKDLYDIQIENLKEKIEDIEEEIKEIKNKK